LAWVFFRAGSLSQAIAVVARTPLELPRTLVEVARGQHLGELLFLNQSRSEGLLVIGLLLFVAAAGYYQRAVAVATPSRQLPLVVRRLASPWVTTVMAAAMFYLFAFHGAVAKSFIYTQF
jgi:fatty acid desaturase